MFEILVEDIFSITGRGTVFAGKIRSGSISVGDPVLCKTRSGEINTRVIGLEEMGTGKLLKTAEPVQPWVFSASTFLRSLLLMPSREKEKTPESSV